MKFVVIGLLALFVIGGGGAGAYIYLNPADGEEVAAKEAEVPETEVFEAAFVELDPFMLTVLGKDRAHFDFGIAVAIQVNSEEHVDRVKALQPKLTHYFLEEMYDSLGRNVDEDKVDISVSEIQGKLLHIAKDIIGDEKVDDVLIQLMNKKPV